MARAASWRGCKLRGGRGSGGADGIRFRADHLVRCGEIWQDAQPGVTLKRLSIPLELLRISPSALWIISRRDCRERNLIFVNMSCI